MLEYFGKSDWSQLETDVIDGVFVPPIAGKQSIPEAHRSCRPPRNSGRYNAIIPDERFRYDARTRTYKSTIGRLLREHTFSTLITLRDKEVTFEFERTARRGLDWLSLHYRSVKPPDLRMVIINNDFEYRVDPDEADRGIRVLRDGIYFVAKFKYTKANRALVQQAGFEFSPVVKWWFTLDPEVAARLEAEVAEISEPSGGAALAGSAQGSGARRAPDHSASAASGSTPGSGSIRKSVPSRGPAPAWVKRRYAAKRKQLSLNLGDPRKPIIRTWK